MAADFDEPVFDDDFVKSATFTEPSAHERARPPSRRERRRARRAARGGTRFRRRHRDPSHRMAVFQVLAGILVLFAISFALWWWNSGSKDEEPAQPIVPTLTNSPAPPPTTAAPTEIPEI